ncbi:MAG TPA: hypothetical protein VMH87_09695 [Pseudomonadales bacterium]|nr:hypothetical protein [Pseudomonadales bacterium]
MAKKEKIGSVSTSGETSRRSGASLTRPSPSASQAAGLDVKTSASAATVSPAQMENAMVQQILERQAVFGF